MLDDNEVVVNDVIEATPEIDTPKQEEVKYNAVELEAISKGWTPKDKFNGDLEDFKGAKAFLKDGKLYEYISESNKSIKELKEALSTVVSNTRKAEEMAYNKAINEMKIKQKEAATIGDVETVAQITDELIQAQSKPVKSLQVAKSEFIARNPWYISEEPEDIEMSRYAGDLARVIGDKNPDISPEELLMAVEQKVKARFQTVKVATPAKMHSAVEASNNTIGSNKRVNVSDLPVEQQQMIKQLKGIKGFNVDQYVKELKDLGVI